MIQLVRVTTYTGSVYEITRNTEGWQARGQNVPNPESGVLSFEDWWAIDHPAPWPPQLGESLLMNAHRSLALDDPRRMPGGGKMTSPIISVEFLQTSL